MTHLLLKEYIVSFEATLLLFKASVIFFAICLIIGLYITIRSHWFSFKMAQVAFQQKSEEFYKLPTSDFYIMSRFWIWDVEKLKTKE